MSCLRTEKGTYSCLIVDDNKTLLAISQAIISDMGIKVECVATGKEALINCKNKVYDIIFLDIELQDISGYRVCTNIRKNKKMASHKSKIVALTASLYTAAQVQRCFDVGMNDCLTKPLKKSVLEKRLMSWITRGDFRKERRL